MGRSRPAEYMWVVVYVYVLIAAPGPSASPCPHPLRDAVPTASGYLPINQTSGSKMFFAYYEAITPQNNTGTPILLWLQGGPGCSGMTGNFYEIGPWWVREDQCLHRNRASWNRIFGLLFLDSPLGSGFSIAPHVVDIPTDQAGVARDVYTALQGFYNRFPALINRPFYVTGESYGSKFVLAVATFILDKQSKQGISSVVPREPAKQLRIDGVALGNGLTHPIAQVQVHAPTAYFMGLIDEKQKEQGDAIAARAVALIKEENWVGARSARGRLLRYIRNVTRLATLMDVRRASGYHRTANGTDYLTLFMNKEEVQRSLLNTDLHRWRDCSNRVRRRISDVAKSAIHMVESLLNQSVPVLLYQGQFDLLDGVASTEAWIRLLQWDGLHNFYVSERKVWKENKVTVGYVRSYSSLTHVVVSNAGHLAPADQPYASQRMIESWVLGLDIVW